MARSKKPTGICHIYKKLLERLPKTYPKPKLIVHPNLSELYSYFCGNSEGIRKDPGYPPQAFCDGDDNTIHVPIQLNRETREDIVKLYLHEIGHLYALNRYGEGNRRWSVYKDSERYANQFASRWFSRLKKERWI